MDLKQLQALGAFTTDRIKRKDITVRVPTQSPPGTWVDPEEPEYTGETTEQKLTVFIRRASSADGMEILQAAKRDQPFIAIQRCIVDEKGVQVFPEYDDAARLKLWIALPLFNAIMEDMPGPKRSRRGTNSGVVSPSPSVDGASGNGSTRSTLKSKRSGIRGKRSKAR